MQLQRWVALMLSLLALAVTPCGCYNAGLRAGGSQQRTQDSAMSAAWAAASQAEAEDRRFWGSEWAALEATLLQLREAAGGSVEAAASSPAGRNASSGNLTAPAAALEGEGASGSGAGEVRRLPPAGLGLNLNPRSTADLLPALGMLKGLYEDGKSRIAKLNAREQQSKQHFREVQATHDARLATIEARFKNRTVSEEFYRNQTRDENRIWAYWQGVRERQHRQFHTSLKIQHGTMQRVKNMIDIYEKTISGKAGRAEVQKDLAKAAGTMPEVVLLQRAWQSSAQFFQDALGEIRTASVEVRRMPLPQ